MPTPTYDKSVLTTELATPQQFTEAERQRIDASIRANGMAVIKNYVSRTQVSEIHEDAKILCKFGFGVGQGQAIEAFLSTRTLEFRYPYLASRGAMDIITNEDLMQLLESHLGPEPIIHNAVMQVSLPREEQRLDWHIDTGSIKSLNPKMKLGDARLRTILYLTDVETGGFSYILNTHEEALQYFLPLPYEALFDPARVPVDPERRVKIHEPAGTFIIFNTHGLHRPEIPRTPRYVLNTWFAKKDFAGNLPATPFDLSLVRKDRRHRLHLFEGQRGCTIANYHERLTEAPKNRTFLHKVRAKLLGAKTLSGAKRGYAHFE